MEITLPHWGSILRSGCAFVAVFLGVTGCDPGDETKVIPTVTTGAATSITSDKATITGQIESDGGLEILESGFIYSATNATPTLQDNFVRAKPTDDKLSAGLVQLVASQSYHVRAFATNQKGTGYGEVVDFTTGNAAPTVKDLFIDGEAKVNNELTAQYTYQDFENDGEDGTKFKWYSADDAAGTGEAAIPGATERTYVVEEAMPGKYIRVGITPNAATGTLAGIEVKSSFIEPTTVTRCAGGAVTYCIIISSLTGRKWLDRNLGASGVAKSADDYANYGDLFQWGRAADGHHSITRTGPTDADALGITGTTSKTAPYQPSDKDMPPNSLFIVVADGDTNNDWRWPQNSSFWQGVNGINNPCPSGWRIPTAAEWAAENLGTLSEAYAKLKLTRSGFRSIADGDIYASDTDGRYWSSSVGLSENDHLSTGVTITDTATTLNDDARGLGYAVRCIKEEY
jgi:uncharacterized protein (TIGR02145 family)